LKPDDSNLVILTIVKSHIRLSEEHEA
jgi:hypothetical protein